MGALSAPDQALADLLAALEEQAYAFVTTTPLTHARMLARRSGQEGRTLADIFGWSLPFARGALDERLFGFLIAAEALERVGTLYACRYRVSRCSERLFLHSAFPTLAPDAVFFGPDSYRFAAFLRRELQTAPSGLRIADIGTGSGVGGLTAARYCADAAITLTDLNPHALRLARINAAAAGVQVEAVGSDGLREASGAFDRIIANPPYLMDAAHRLYRDGGAACGGHVALEWTAGALERLSPRGQFLLYTGSAIVAGADPLRNRLAELAHTHNCAFACEEIDPDVWSEELQTPAYEHVDRIAILGARFTRT